MDSYASQYAIDNHIIHKDISFFSGDYKYILQSDDTVILVGYTGNASVLVLPETLDGIPVTAIAENAFDNESSRILTGITIPENIVTIEGTPFAECKSLAIITISPSHPVFATIDGVLFNKREKKLIWYSPMRSEDSYTVPQGITMIGDYAFANNSNLHSIQIPDSVTVIGAHAFEQTSDLVLAVTPGSAAERFVIEHHILYTLPEASTDWLQ